jgi:hypothetical protein
MVMVVINPALELEPAMKNLFLTLVLALGVLGSAVAVSAISSTHAAACPEGSSGC